jgi:hypothetical protein
MEIFLVPLWFSFLLTYVFFTKKKKLFNINKILKKDCKKYYRKYYRKDIY